jgi:hypothetical protein
MIWNLLTAALVILCISGSLGYFQRQVLFGESYKMIMQNPMGTAQVPSRELRAGMGMQQQIELPVSLFKDPLKMKKSEKKVISILMATYNRINTARYFFYLKQNGVVRVKILDGSKVLDNTYHDFVFSKNEFEPFVPGNAVIGIKSINGKPGNAIALWIRKDNRKMMLRLAITYFVHSEFIVRLFFLIISTLSIFILIFTWMSYSQKNTIDPGK